MKFYNYLNEKSNKGWGLTAIDIDETIFKTFAKIYVMKEGKIVKKLNNKEFNSYTLKDDESFDFREFRNAKLFNKTSIPIPKTINRIKKMLNRIKETGSMSKIIFLTARTDFDDKNEFLKTFETHGINMDINHTYVERAGNIKQGTTESKKKKIILNYLKTGLYRRVRLIDDYEPNLKALLEIENNLPKEIKNKVIKQYNLSDDEIPIKFWALLIDDNGKLKEI